jgi:phosphoribosylamine--glycine ligase
MNILIIGSGGREHALAWKVAQSPTVKAIWVAPGNAGTAHEAKTQNIPIEATNLPALLAFAQEKAIDLTIVGPETPLGLGIVDIFREHHLPCFGPTKAAAQLETSKAFSKDFMVRHHIPTAQYETFTDFEAAKGYLDTQDFPIVIKEDGLAAGKGVVIAHSKTEAIQTLQSMFNRKNRVVIEEFLAGEEASFIVITDGQCILPLATSQDHKALREGDQGPNTGGMGAYSPAPVVTPALHQTIMDTIIRPTVDGMAKEGIPYQGFLYAGLMIKNGSVKVLEYNCRLGDPEAEVILPRLQSELVPLCQAVLENTLHHCSIKWDARIALGVVLAMEGYPNAYPKGLPISGLNQALPKDQKIFHAGTQVQLNQTVTAGGRVLCVTGMGHSIQEAQKSAYAAVDKVSWEGKYFRKDIGYRAVRLSSAGAREAATKDFL